MTNLSKPFKLVMYRISRHFNPMKFSQRNSSYNLRKMDKESYLNKKITKGTTDPYGVATLIVPCTCFGLAIWQMNRKFWKNTLTNDMNQRMFLPAVDVPKDLTDRMKMEYRRVNVCGTFDHSRELYIGPRSLIINNKFAESPPILLPTFGNAPETNIGYIVVTPFKLVDRDVEILVNRGWVPMSKKDPSTRQEGQIEGIVELEGIVRLTEGRPNETQKKEDPRTYKWRDLTLLSEKAKTSCFYIDAAVESTVPGGPRGGQTQVKLKDDHLEYCLTWTVLGLYTFYMWYKRWILKRF